MALVGELAGNNNVVTRPRYGSPRVLILDNGLGIADRLPKALAGTEVVYIQDLTEVDRYPAFNMLCVGLALSHMGDKKEAAAFIQQMVARFSLVLFFEVSACGRDYLRSFDLSSYHLGFSENVGIDYLGIEFVAGAAHGHGVYKAEHFAGGAAFDSFKNWIVPSEHPQGTFPKTGLRGAYQVFDRPVFELSVYVLSGFASTDPPLADDLLLIESRLLQFRPQSAGVGLDRIKRAAELGRCLYTTHQDAPARLLAREITLPTEIWDDAIYGLDERRKSTAEWRREFKIERVDISVFELPDCIVTGSGALFSGGVFVWGTDYLFMYLYSSTLDPIFTGMQKRHKSLHVEGIAILGFNGLYDNYYHFTAEAMTSVSLCLDIVGRTAEPVTIITGTMNGFRRHYLSLLTRGNPSIQILELERTEFVTADRLIYCDLLGSLSQAPSIILERVPFIEKMLRSCALEAQPASRLIYLARTDSAARKMLNEDQLIARLRGLGFEIFVASAHDVPTQIATFHSARFIVAPHGAGLTNAMYVQPGTIVLELVQADYLNTGMMRLAQLAQANYYSEMFFTTSGWEKSWSVDIDRVCETINKLLSL